MDAGRTSTGHDRLSGEERWAEYAANVGQKPKAFASGRDCTKTQTSCSASNARRRWVGNF